MLTKRQVGELKRKLKYLHKRWGYVVIGRERKLEPMYLHFGGLAFDFDIGVKTSFCRNHDVDEDGTILRNGLPFLGELEGISDSRMKIEQVVNQCYELEKKKEEWECRRTKSKRA